MRYVITSGTSLREYVGQRNGAKVALDHVLSLIRRRYPNVRVFDEDGRKLRLDDLRRHEAQESRAVTRQALQPDERAMLGPVGQ
jgi:hypothetical protein